MKSFLRENRVSNGTRAKVNRVVKDLRANPPARSLAGLSGLTLFAIWKDQKGKTRR